MAMAVPCALLAKPGSRGASTRKPGSLAHLWDNYNESLGLHRLLDDADDYERHLPPREGSTPLRMLEIGVQSGGSARTWKQWYGSRLTYVGVDVNSHCRRTQSPSERIWVEIGSQSNATFLEGVCRKYGPFDIVIDDGAHRPETIRASLQTLFPAAARCMKLPSLYVIEDTETMMMSRYQPTLGSAREYTDILAEAFWAMCAQPHPAPPSPTHPNPAPPTPTQPYPAPIAQGEASATRSPSDPAIPPVRKVKSPPPPCVLAAAAMRARRRRAWK